jgi:hypothetical protein
MPVTADDDHLARLCFEGTGPSVGRYSPRRSHVRLAGQQETVDSVVYLHEVHHGMLNDSTAWGTLLHLYARLPGASRRFRDLLAAARAVHESYATSASVGIASAHFGESTWVLSAYPEYVPLHAAVTRLTDGIDGANRRLTVVSAMARACLQGPSLQAMCEQGAQKFTLASVRRADRPDERWSWLLRRGRSLAREAALAADRENAGQTVLDLDVAGAMLTEVTAPEFDGFWRSWEIAAYEVFRRELADNGARVLDFDGHQEGTELAVTLAQAAAPDTGLRAASPGDQQRGDPWFVGDVIRQFRHHLHPADRLTAAFVDMPVRELATAVAGSGLIDGTSVLVTYSRLPARLAQLYEWRGTTRPDPGDRVPATAVRVIVGDDQATVILHRPIQSPAEMRELASAWADRGPVVHCVSASCLTEAQWRDAWLPVMGASLIVLVDVEPTRLTPSWQRAGSTMRGARIQVQDSSGTRAGLLLAQEHGPLWFAIADDMTIGLLTRLVEAALGGRFDGHGGFSQAELTTMRLAAAHLLATESFVDFDGLEEYL